jgi:hypothetical protein
MLNLEFGISNGDGQNDPYPILAFFQMALDVLGWTKENREDVNFVLESRLLFTPSNSSSVSEPNWRRGWTAKMSPVSALLVTLGRNSLEPPSQQQDQDEAVYGRGLVGGLQFPTDTRAKQAALLLIREKNSRFNLVRVSNKSLEHGTGNRASSH